MWHIVFFKVDMLKVFSGNADCIHSENGSLTI